MKMSRKNINLHNVKMSKEKDDSQNDRCNCMNRTKCPCNGNCFINNIINKASVNEEDKNNKNVYISGTELNCENGW